ncbi:MAG TPA: ABC transporter permease [Candidatus Nitrosotenuis sp.]|nr:ABC transporter permease [Candidatus Nitrosotenuis sp.]
MGLKRYIATRAIILFGVLMATLLITILLVGSNMDTIMKKGVAIQVRTEITENKQLVNSFKNTDDLNSYIQGQVERRTKSLGLDMPWYSPNRIGLSMYKILVLDFGHATFLTSDSGSSAVSDIILEKLPRTILLFTTSTIIIGLIGIFVGAASGSNIHSKIDKITSSFAIISSSFPVWWVGLIMIFTFSFSYNIFPARATPLIPPSDPGYISSLFYHMTLPLITIVMIGFGTWAYLVRNFMVGIMQEDFIFVKKTIGIKQRKIVFGSALKNAAPPIVTVLALSLSGSLGGAIITEAVFDWPGMGRLYFEAINVMDLPVIIGATYVLTAVFLISIFVSDLLYGYLDPRIRTV